MGEIVSAIYSMVKFVECENEKNELIKIEVDTIFSSFNIVSLNLESKALNWIWNNFKQHFQGSSRRT